MDARSRLWRTGVSALYSKRNAEPATELRYDIPDKARRRIIAILLHELGEKTARMFLAELHGVLLREYGELAAPLETETSQRPLAFTHFLYCNDEQALDFIEACFRINFGVGGQRTVDEINRAFREEAIGYELTAYRGPKLARGEKRFGGTIPDDQFPQAIRPDHQLLHEAIMKPTLQLLSNPVLAVANTEMLKAHSDHRAGRHQDAITTCSSAFESVLKTICDQKGWAYNADRDACATLVDICFSQGLFHSFYVDLFKRVGTIRNKLGTAHGRGPKPLHNVEAADVEHMLYMTSSNVILLCKLAELE